MKGAFVILLFTIAVGLILYLLDLRHRSRNPKIKELTDDVIHDAEESEGDASGTQQNAEAVQQDDAAAGNGDEEGGQCCGMHLVCEKDSLSPTSAVIEYYDDEELDRFIGRDGTDYTPEEAEEFQEVLMTMRPEDVTGWARSITQRRIVLPPVVHDELLMLVNESRQHS